MKRATFAVLILFTLSGAAGLTYEILWIRMLSHLLGGTTFAISTVLASFMAGLALGSRYYGGRADRMARPLRFYAMLEFGIAAFAALVYVVIRLAPSAYVAVSGVIPGAALAAFRVIVALVLLLPPTFLMGGTLPVLSRFIVRSRDRVGRGLGLLYAINTFGAVIGSFLTGFVLIAALGHLGTVVLAVAVNVVVGALVWAIDRTMEPSPTSDSGRPADGAKGAAADAGGGPPEMTYALLAGIFALSGFASLGYELYWTRALQHFLGNSTYAFSAMLTTFLFGLASGGWVGGRLADRVSSPARLLGWVQLLVGVFALSTVMLIWGWLPLIKDGPWLTDPNLSMAGRLARGFLVTFVVMALPTFLTGMTFPLVNRVWIRSIGRIGLGVGHLYFANTVGSIAGSLAAGFVVLPLLGAKGALIATAGLSVALGLACHVGRRNRALLDALVATVALGALVVASPQLEAFGRVLLADAQSPEDAVLFEAEDHAAETRVFRKASGDLYMSVDGHHIGGTEANVIRKEKILAHLPMMLRPGARRTLSVGLGSGITLGTLAMYDEIESLGCVEIVPGVIDGARHFDGVNRHVLDDPRLDLHCGDGVQYLLTTRERFDIIVSDSKLNPEYSGNAPLLSSNYYALCRDRLSDDGVMVQWLAVHLPAREIQIIARSFAGAFPYATVYWLDPSHVIFAGSKSPLVFDMDAAARQVERDEIGGDLAELKIADPYVLGSLFICNRERLLDNLGAGVINSWDHPVIEFTMSRRYLEKRPRDHEDDTLRWLKTLREPAGQRLSGRYDVATHRRYLESAGALLDGFAMGGGVTRLQNAFSSFQAALSKNPDDGRLEDVVVNLERVTESIDQEVTSGSINTTEELLRAGMLRRDQGRHEEALALFARALKDRPDDASIRYNYLLSLRDAGRSAEFEDELNRFIDEFPDNSRGYTLRGRKQAAAGDLEAAVASFRRAVELDPEGPHSLNNLATALAGLERYEEAGRMFEAVCEFDPRHQNAAYFAAASFSMAAMPAEAAKWAAFCIDNGIASAQQFATDPLFANLRSSDHWDAATSRPR